MRVLIEETGKKEIDISFPNQMLVNRFCLYLANRYLQKKQVYLTNQHDLPYKQLKQCLKRHRGLVLVEISSKEGDHIVISI